MEREFNRKHTSVQAKNLFSIVWDFCDKELLYESRVHPLSTFSSSQNKVFMKREDESSFGISGYKKRKYASLLPFLQNQQVEETLVIGTAFSNHVCGILQLLIENHLPYSLWLKEAHQLMPKGNWFLTQLLSQSDQIKWIPSKKWETVTEGAQAYASKAAHRVFILPEGGSVRESVAGAATLCLDLLRNEQQLEVDMDHIFMDAGTGFTAACTAYMLGYLERKVQCHLVKIGDPKEDYQPMFSKVAGWMEELIGVPPKLPPIHWYQPMTAKSFGQVNQGLSLFIKEFAQQEGVLTDPIYSAKLCMTAKHIIHGQKLEGNILIIHSGGGVGLLGHAERIKIS
ncbi:MAG: hypothetical protein AAF824_00560 [Bacteroidota bacterium]